MVGKDDLKAMWPGIAIFKDAFLNTLPRRTRSSNTPDPFATSQASRPRAAPSRTVRRGANVHYTPGPEHRRTVRGTWTHYMVRTVLAHRCTHDAIEAHRNSGQFSDKTLDFNWMFKINLITKVQVND